MRSFLLCFLIDLHSLRANAAAVALVRVHMASAAGAHAPAETRFPAGVGTVYFDYTVRTPVADSSGQVLVYAGGVTGAPVAQAPVLLRLAASLSAALQPASGAWPDGGYCTVLLVDGSQDTANGSMPIGWVVGKGSVPHACEPRLRFDAVSSHSSRHIIRLRLVVGDSTGRKVAGVSVRVNGRPAGMARSVTRITAKGGVAAFSGLRIAHAGMLKIRASKAGYRAVTLDLPVGG